MIIFVENLASMKHPLLPLLFAVALTVLPLRAQDKVTRSVLELGRTDNRTMEHADYIARNIGGRIVGSHMLNHAEDWVAAHQDTRSDWRRRLHARRGHLLPAVKSLFTA